MDANLLAALCSVGSKIFSIHQDTVDGFLDFFHTLSAVFPNLSLRTQANI